MCHAHSIHVDQSGDFSDKILTALNSGALAIMISIGHGAV